MQHIILDGNNLCYRVYFTNRKLSYNNVSVSLVYGVLRSILAYKKEYPDHCFTIVWDSKSTSRKELSKKGIADGLIKKEYKACRETDDNLDKMKEVFEQFDILKEVLQFVNINQVVVKGYEADDVIYTYSKLLTKEELIVISSDKDYYQMLREGLILIDGVQKITWTVQKFKEKYDIDPDLWVDKGSLQGDISDSIEGVPGIGEVTALKLVKKYGTVENMLSVLENTKDRSNPEEKVMKFKEKLILAKELKKMQIVPDLPELLKKEGLNKKDLEVAFMKHGFFSLILDIGKFIA